MAKEASNDDEIKTFMMRIGYRIVVKVLFGFD